MNGPNTFIPFNGVSRQYKVIEYELRHELDIVLSSGDLLNGHKKAIFEDQIACRVGREYAIAVNSGTNAIHYIFDYLAHHGLAKTESNWSTTPQIAVPNYSFRSTVNSIADRGQPRYIDVDSMTGLMDFQTEAFQKKLDIIMYVNLFGNMIDYEEMITVVKLFSENHDAKIIEDACQSFGATYKGKPSGSFGDFSVFSFDPTKNFGSSTGGGGMILTDDHYAAGWFFNYLSNGVNNYNVNTGVPAVNSYMSEIDCAGMLVKLQYFDEWQERRREIADYYSANLHESIVTPDQTVTEGVEHAYSKYVIMSNRRDTIKNSLEKSGIESKIHYEIQPFAPAGLQEVQTGARLMSNNVLSLPIYPELTDAEVERIVQEVNKPLITNLKMMFRVD